MDPLVATMFVMACLTLVTLAVIGKEQVAIRLISLLKTLFTKHLP